MAAKTTRVASSGRKGYVRQAFTFKSRFTTSATINSFSVDPVNSATAFGVPLITMAKQYQQFRCVGLEITVYPTQVAPSATGAADTALYIGYRSQRSGNPPSTGADVMESSVVLAHTDGMSVPSVFKIPRKMLTGMMIQPWLHQQVSGTAYEAQQQGDIYYIAEGTNSSTWVQLWVVRSEWEFRGEIPFDQELKLVAAPRLGNLDAPPSSLPSPSMDKDWVLPDSGGPAPAHTPFEVDCKACNVKRDFRCVAARFTARDVGTQGVRARVTASAEPGLDPKVEYLRSQTGT